MNYSIIGAGNVGAALARHFAKHHLAVSIANTRGPASLTALAQDIGDSVHAVALDEALRADLIILAIPFKAHAAVAAMLPDWSGKIVIDAMNAYGVDPADLQGLPSSAVVARAFRGAALVKTFNQLPAKLLAQEPRAGGGRRVMFVSGDDAGASATAAALAETLGFAAIDLGALADGGALLGMQGPLILQNLVKF